MVELIKPDALMANNSDNFFYFENHEICISQFTIVFMYTMIAFFTVCFFTLGNTIIRSKRSSLEQAYMEELSDEDNDVAANEKK